jgi:hypothetical protein
MQNYINSFRSALPVLTEMLSALNWLRNNPITGVDELTRAVKSAHDNTQVWMMGLSSYVEVAKQAERFTSPG